MIKSTFTKKIILCYKATLCEFHAMTLLHLSDCEFCGKMMCTISDEEYPRVIFSVGLQFRASSIGFLLFPPPPIHRMPRWSDEPFLNCVFSNSSYRHNRTFASYYSVEHTVEESMRISIQSIGFLLFPLSIHPSYAGLVR